MGEIKSVKVDNWGVFFLQKLQNFFNKTDYCDLTLQFRDNSQLKVHRLVLSACTDYFNVLEQTCEVIDDALIMPNELQADVVVPIVNFMYTGTLEFELKMYGKLLRTAKEMNMTVLLKLLEAHRRTMESVNRAQRPPSPKAIRRRMPMGIQTNPPIVQQIRRVESPGGGGGGGPVERRMVQTKSTGTNVSTGMQAFRQQIGSTSVVRTTSLKQTNQPTIQTFIKSEPEEYDTLTTMQPTSPFEQLRKGYNNNKRPAVTTFSSPPTKKPNLEDVKEFAEQQRMRKQIAAEYGDDQEFEGLMDDDIHNDDDDDDGALIAPSHTTANVVNTGTNDGIRTTSITFKHENDGQPPTIIVKDSSGSKLNHAKIISEVLRQYPHLAKGNKNIKLRVMPNATTQPTQRVAVKKEPEQNIQQPVEQQKTSLPSQLLSSQLTIRAGDRVISQGQGQQQISSIKSYATSMVPKTNAAAVPITEADSSQQKRRIDSKTMHSLIALGAENTTGPWLCLRCGVNGRPISIPSYRGFRRHLINTHKEAIDPALCEHCGWRSHTNRELHFHLQIDHKIKTTLYTFPDCSVCNELFLDTSTLNQHMLSSHPSANKQQCIYCNKIFVKEMQLYTHMKLYHKHQALEDGIIDASDEEFSGMPEDDDDDDTDEGEQMDIDSDHDMRKQMTTERKEAKVKILSDISLPMASSIVKLDNSNDDIKGNLDASTKFVTADGNEMILTEEQRKEIMSQLNQDHNNGGVVMVLQETIFPAGEVIATETANSADEVSARGEMSEEELEDSQIYDELGSAQTAASQHNKTEKEPIREVGKETMDNLEWAENLISEHELTESENDVPAKKTDEDKSKKDHISQKLKELTGDWSEDENEEDTNDGLEKSEKPDSESRDKPSNDVIETTTDSQMEEELLTKSDKEESNHSTAERIIDLTKISHAEELEQIFPEETAKSEIKNETEKVEEDELDLAMQNLHEGDDDDTLEKKNGEGGGGGGGGGTPTLDEHIKMDIENENVKKEMKMKMRTEETDSKKPSGISILEPNMNTLNMPSEVLDQNTALLDEFMATSEGGEILNLDEAKHKVDDEFDDVELNDVEEFSALDKSDKEPTTNIPIVKEMQSLGKEENTKLQAEEETKNVDKVASSSSSSVVVNVPETSSIATKSLSSDWEDIEDDDDGDEDELGDIAVNDAA